MVIVGFDVGKLELFGARIDRSGVVRQRYHLANTPEALEPLLQELARHHHHLLIAAEATAEYHRPLALTCLKLGIACRLLNPITTKQFTRATVRRRKTDLTDAEVIARVALQGGGTIVTEALFNPVKPMVRTAIKLVQMDQSLLLMSRHLDVAAADDVILTEELAACSRRLQEATRVFRAQAAERTDPVLRKLLETIPGVGPVTAAILVAEIGDITRFASPKALVAYAGLDPRVRQSGTSLNRNTHLTKRGSPYLRRALYIAAASAQRHDATLKETYERKRIQGKRYTEATIVVARKILNRVYAVWKRGTPYRREIA